MYGENVKTVKIALLGAELKFLYRNLRPRTWDRLVRGTLIDPRITTVYMNDTTPEDVYDEAYRCARYGFAQHMRESYMIFFNSAAPNGAIDHNYHLRGGVTRGGRKAFNPRYLLRIKQ